MEELQQLLESTVPPSLKTKIKGKEAREIALLIKPLMEEINIKTGQENDLMFMAYACQHYSRGWR